MIRFRDSNSIVLYLQVFLKNYYPNPVISDPENNSYTQVNNKVYTVTGTYDSQTYMLLSCYMYSYYPNEGFPYVLDDPSSKKMRDFDPETDDLAKVISDNIQYAHQNKEYVLNIPARILSYIFGEVVSENSTHDEIFRVQKLLYSQVPLLEVGQYTEEMKDQIKSIQKNFIDQHTHKVVDEHGDPTGEVVISMPTSYEGFKVTGYVDPWTEEIING